MRRLLGFVVTGVLLTVAAPAGRVSAQQGPVLAVHDQQLVSGVVVIDTVWSPEPGWVDIHREAEVAGNPGAVIGYAPIGPGETNYLLAPVDLDRVSPVLYAVLHADRGQPGEFEFPGPDEPVQVDGKALTVSFKVLDEPSRPSSEPPRLEVRDQALRDGQVIVGRVVTGQSGWVDIHAEAETAGNPGPVIGYAPVSKGESTYVRVPVETDQITPVLYVVLHLDAGETGRFEFPGPDVPVQLEGQSIVAPFRLAQPAATPTPQARASVAPATPTGPVPTTPSAPAASPTTARAATLAATRTPTSAATPTATPMISATRTPTMSATPTPTISPTPTPLPSPSAPAGAALSTSPSPTPRSASAVRVGSPASEGPASSEPQRLPVTGASAAPGLVLALGALLAVGGALLRAAVPRRR